MLSAASGRRLGDDGRVSDEADWDELWRTQAVDGNKVLEEERSLRWQQIETFIAARMGGFGGLRHRDRERPRHERHPLR
jgi:hypothetical protein